MKLYATPMHLHQHCCHRYWHAIDVLNRPQLNQRLHVDTQQEIKDRIDIEERELQFAIDNRVCAATRATNTIRANEFAD
jgi:hypothetical protein